MRTPDIIMTVSEVDRSGRFEAYVDGRYAVTSAQPFLDAARVLIEQGYDPARRLVMRRVDREQVDLVALLGVAAGLTVRTNRYGTPTLHRYRKGALGADSASQARFPAPADREAA